MIPVTWQELVYHAIREWEASRRGNPDTNPHPQPSSPSAPPPPR